MGMISLFGDVVRYGGDKPEDGATIARVDLDGRVAKGAAWLDVTVPGWFNKIELGDLWLGGCDSCIMGQLFRDFNAIQAYLFATVPDFDAVAMGLDLNDDTERSEANWNTLTNSWRASIVQRKKWLRRQRSELPQTVDAVVAIAAD